MNRRSLLQSALAVSALIPGLTGASSAMAGNRPKGDPIKPARLVKGMTVGLVAPASPGSENEVVRFGIDTVRSLGFEVKEGKHLFSRNQYLAGSDRERAEDVNAMFRDRKVDAIICLRGGYGTMRMLPYLDYEMIQKHPKVLSGFSDITGLHNAIYARTGLVTFHGPVADQTFTDYTLAEFKKVLMNPSATSIIGSPPPFEGGEGNVERRNRITRFVGGKARGRLIGGNLSLISRLLGTPYEPDFRDSILFLEDVHEAPYRIDRMLTHLWLAGKLDQVAGIVMGKFTDSKDEGNTFSLEEVMEQRFVPLGKPAIRGLMIGHINDQTVVPIGVQAELDADAGTLTLLEPAVT